MNPRRFGLAWGRWVALWVLVGVLLIMAWPRLSGGWCLAVAKGLYQEALTLREEGQDLQAVEKARRALDWLQDAPHDFEALQNTHHLLGVLYHDRSSLWLAVQHFETSLQWVSEPHQMAAAVVALEALGQIHREQGDFQSAVRFYEQAHAHRVAESPLAEAYWTTADQLAELYGDLTEYPLGVGVDLMLLEHWRRQAGAEADPSIPVAALTRLGYQHTIHFQYDEAHEALAQALTMLDQLPEGSESLKAALFNNLGIWAYYKKQWSDALKWFQQSLALREAQGPTWAAAVAQSHHNLGRLFLEQRNFKKALEHAQLALPLSEKGNGVSHPYTQHVIELMIEIETQRKNPEAAQQLQARLDAMREKQP